MMFQALAIFAVFMVLLFLLRGKLGLFWSTTAFFVGTMAYLEFGFDPPVPASVMALYGVTSLVAMLLYVTSSEENREAFLAPIIAVLTEKRLFGIRVVLLLVVPLALSWVVYQGVLPSASAPPKIRSVHPSPPGSLDVLAQGMIEPSKFDMLKGTNPLRALETSDPDAFAEHVARGKIVYYQNCYYCHGDYMAADGHYATAVKPPPASFQDPGTIAMLEESFLYWRVVKGGPGLPDSGTPWDSSMPVWEKMLNVEDMWAVILFMYDYTGYKPRAKEDLGHGGGH